MPCIPIVAGNSYASVFPIHKNHESLTIPSIMPLGPIYNRHLILKNQVMIIIPEMYERLMTWLPEERLPSLISFERSRNVLPL